MGLWEWLVWPSTDDKDTKARSRAGPPPILSDLRLGVQDEAGYTVLDIYARKLPDYVVYRTGQRVAVQYADRRIDAAKQRKMMAALNPLRGEINGLIDGWRLKRNRSRAQRRAERFDRRVADALVAALEGDVTNADVLLRKIWQEILDERTAWARLQYVLFAFLAGAAGTAISVGVVRLLQFPPVAGDLDLAARAGLIGAFFSIASGLRNRTVLPDLQWTANMLDAVLRMLVGMIGAGILIAMVDAGMVNVTIGLPDVASAAGTAQAPPSQMPPPQPGGGAPGTAPAPSGVTAGGGIYPEQPWLKILIFGFVAGFSERFVPDLLAKAVATSPAATPGSDLAPTLPKPPPTDGKGDGQAARKPDEDGEGALSEPDGGAFGGDPSGDAAHDGASSGAGAIQSGAHDDACTCSHPLDAAEATRDEHLPAASGGVASPDAA